MFSERQSLRIELRNRRNSLTPKQQLQNAQAIVSRCLAVIDNSAACALYLANDGELSPQFLAEALHRQQNPVLLPVMHPFRKGYLNFQQVLPEQPLRLNRFSIPEPAFNSQTTWSLHHINYVFMPLVGFDAHGNRLGMGGGFYDRTFNRFQSDYPKLIGLAHDCQQVEHIPNESWDVPMHAIITPTQTIQLG